MLKHRISGSFMQKSVLKVITSLKRRRKQLAFYFKTMWQEQFYVTNEALLWRNWQSIRSAKLCFFLFIYFIVSNVNTVFVSIVILLEKYISLKFYLVNQIIFITSYFNSFGLVIPLQQNLQFLINQVYIVHIIMHWL